jgi:hypothetical protein
MFSILAHGIQQEINITRAQKPVATRNCRRLEASAGSAEA